MEEIWKDIPGLEGEYQASTLGRIRSLDRKVHVGRSNAYRTMRGRILRPGKQNKSGHLTVVLGRAHGSMPVHTAVALTFIGPRPQGMDVCHNDGNPENNRVENLRYDTRTENIFDVYRIGKGWRKLTLAEIKEIKRLSESGIHGAEIAQKFNIAKSTVSSIKCGRYKTCQQL